MNDPRLSRRILRCWKASAFFTSLTLSAPLLSAASFQVGYLDAQTSEGFYDATEVQPVPGNSGTTLGEQRRIAFEAALSIWEATLVSSVPIKVAAEFVELPCSFESGVLGAAVADGATTDFQGAQPDIYYPAPLADHLAGEDLRPGRPDVWAEFNSALDDSDCLGGVGWDYSLEGAGGDIRFLNTVLHEMAHGLGFAALVAVDTGQVQGGFSPFEQNLFDVELGLYWDEMTAAERSRSATTPFGLAWAGQSVTAAAPLVLARGRPYLQVEGQEPLSLVGEANFGQRSATQPIQGELWLLDAAQACGGTELLDGRIIMLTDEPACNQLAQIKRVQERGAAGAVLRATESLLPPWSIDEQVGSGAGILISSLTIGQADFDALAMRVGEHPQIVFDAVPGLVGTSPAGMVLLNATDPLFLGSSVTHWDRSVRLAQASPSAPATLLMEPFDNGNAETSVSSLTMQVLEDIGWEVTDSARPQAGDSAPTPSVKLPALTDADSRGEEPVTLASDAGNSRFGMAGSSLQEEGGCACTLSGGKRAPTSLAISLAGLLCWVLRRTRARVRRC